MQNGTLDTVTAITVLHYIFYYFVYRPTIMRIQLGSPYHIIWKDDKSGVEESKCTPKKKVSYESYVINLPFVFE